MALRDVSAFVDWLNREKPSDKLAIAVFLWLRQLGDTPWAAPSVPVPQLTTQPKYEVREIVASYQEQRAWIMYRHWYATGDVDVIDITHAQEH